MYLVVDRTINVQVEEIIKRHIVLSVCVLITGLWVFLLYWKVGQN
jgi:hypothetical protein